MTENETSLEVTLARLVKLDKDKIEIPRQFVDAEDFFGPDRRRKNEPYTGVDRRKIRIMADADITFSSKNSPKKL